MEICAACFHGHRASVRSSPAIQLVTVKLRVKALVITYTPAPHGRCSVKSSRMSASMIENDYPTSEWNIYPFHFSDGDNWSAEDTLGCVEILKNRIIPASNVFCYGQVDSPYGSGQFIKDLRQHFGGNDGVIVSEIANRDRIVESIRDFLGKGK